MPRQRTGALKQNGKRSGNERRHANRLHRDSEERERLLAIYEADLRAIIEAYATEHGVTVREAINTTVPLWLDRPRG